MTTLPQDHSVSAVVIRGLTKRYANQAQPALDAVDLTVAAGSIHGVLGPSGAGKTTLLRCIARIEQPDSGSIVIGGLDWTYLSVAQLRRERGRMGVVFQQLHLLHSRTVAANIAFPLELRGDSKEKIHSRVSTLLDWFGIQEQANSYPAKISGGQRQRVALARALATEPTVLLADEPTSALDPGTRSSVLKILQQIRDELGVTILLITHDLQASAAICDTLTVLDNGRVVESGSAKQILERPSAAVTQRLLAGRHSPVNEIPVSGHLEFEEIVPG